MAPTIIVTTPTRDLNEFRAVAAMAARLQSRGKVEVNIAAVAQKAAHERPRTRSPWHEYAACNPAPEKFTPHPLLAPHLPAAFVEGNRGLMLAKAAVLREAGLGAAFWSYLPNFWPESFFAEHPELRGPRTDHPRRSTHAEFAPCVDQPRTLEVMRWQVRELCRLVPHLGTLFFKTNDAGPGLCWSHWQYAGPNGPEHCRGRGMGRRVRGMLEALRGGAAEAGVDLAVHFRGNFSAAERAEVVAALPDHCSTPGAAGAAATVPCAADRTYPVRGLFDPLAVLRALAGRRADAAVFVDLRCAYDRAGEPLPVAEQTVALVDRLLAEPVSGTLGPLQRLREHCAGWAGGGERDELFEVLVDLHEALSDKAKMLPGLSAIYGGVSLRYVTRPLVWDPAGLSAAEEAHFLPHVFNVDEGRARLDWLDQHASRIAPHAMPTRGADPRLWSAYALCDRLRRVARGLRGCAEAGAAAWVRDAAAACELYASIVRSGANFYAGQVLRERNAAASPVDVNCSAWLGHPDYAAFQEVLRDELDNTTAFAALLRGEAGKLITTATAAADEDTFVLGPDLAAQVATKAALMRRHWRDAERALAAPNR